MPEEILAPPIASDSPPSPTTTPTQPIGEVSGTGVEGGAPTAPAPLDPDYVSRAKVFSLSEDELRAIPRETVERMIASSDRAFINSARQDFAQGPPPPPPQQQPHPVARRENGQFAAPPTDFAYEPWKPQFDADEEVAEPITKNMTALEQHVAKQFDRLHQHYAAKHAAQEQFQTDTITQRNNATMDRFVESRGPEWESVFGKGPTSEMNPQSQEFLNRAEVWMAATVMVQRSARHGIRLTIEEAQPRAANAMFMEKAFAIEHAKANALSAEKRLKDIQAQLPPATGRMGAFAAAGANGSVKTSDADFLRRVRGG